MFTHNHYTFTSVIWMIQTGLILLYMIRLPKQVKATRILTLFYVVLFLHSFVTFIINFLPSGAFFSPFKDFLFIILGITLLQFSYHFPVYDEPRVAKLFTFIGITAALLLLIFSLFTTFQPTPTESSTATQTLNYHNYFIIGGMLSLILIFLGRSLRYTPQKPTFSIKMRLQVIGQKLLSPPTPEAKTLRDLAVVISISFSPILFNQILPPEAAIVVDMVTGLLSTFLMALVYFNYAAESHSFVNKLLGVSLLIVLTIFGLIGLQTIQTIQRNISSEQVQQVLNNEITQLLFWVMITVLLMLILFPRFFRSNLVQPLYKLIYGVQEAMNGNLDIAVPVTFEDEIGSLTHDFNQMIVSLRESRASLKQMNTTLEHQVDIRTADLATAKEKAETANQTKSRFLANMSHELRTPLNTILGFAQVMERSQTLPEEHHENLTVISHSGEHLLALINQVLDLAKIESGRSMLNETDCDLHRLLSDLEEMFRLKAEEKGLTLSFYQEETLPQYVHLDAMKLRQILINLISNAIKFTMEGGIVVHACLAETTSMSAKNTIQLHFKVEDTGMGIAPEEQDQLFEAFAQTQSGLLVQEGTGLGLPISYQFVQMMGGNLLAESNMGQGSLFKFDIPVHVIESFQDDREQTQRQVIALQPGQDRYRILIVDDKWANRQLLIKLLGPLGFDLREAKNGREALSVWTQFKPHLIWMDMRMPLMDGYETTRQIKATDPTSKIVALTASSLAEERSAILDTGCDDYLRKPFRAHEIFDMLHKHAGVQFIYNEPLPVNETRHNEPLSPELLATLPVALLNRLEETAVQMNVGQVQTIIYEIAQLNPSIAQSLQRLADTFEYMKIVDLIQATQGEIDPI